MEVFEFFTAVTVLFAASSPAERQFYFVNELKNWTEAQTYCREQHTDLVTIRSQENLTTLIDMVKPDDMVNMKDGYENRAWIGLISDANSWEWSMSDPNFFQNAGDFEYRNWRSGQPDNSQKPENCVRMYDDGLWDDNSCEQYERFVCADVNGQNVTFLLSDIFKPWPEAQAYCRKEHSDLATARNMAENEMIKQKMLPGQFAWIGLHKSSWTWVDGSKPLFTLWKTTVPNDGYVCAVANIKDHGKWDNTPCDWSFPFFCYGDKPENIQENIQVPVSRLAVKLKLQNPLSLDLNDVGVLEDLLVRFKQKLKDDKLEGDIRLSWRGQSDGTVFRKDG
ncbi:C-type mannose receptor 2-like [Fundulus heteroclitus]|uniref:C-type mannose receptor 2-like n=1 Tax=Fundulus heteroclitus TaxID=8078 RepID=UPI00165CD877|nr:C-type mannose receptor 2-like [Fundulus heteroclitus]